MAELIRLFAAPSSLTNEQNERLFDALQKLPDRQRQLAGSSPTVAAASSVRRVDQKFELHYDISDQQSPGSVIKSDRPQQETLIDWAMEICDAFMIAYPAGQSAVMRHGGLCAASVVATSQGNLRILDFGVAECFASVMQSSDESWIMQVASHVAPEIWNTPARFGQQSDIFSVGVLLYQLATGRHPFGAIADDPDDCKYQILIEVPAAPKKLDPAMDQQLSQLIHLCLRSALEKRYQSFQELLEALQQCRANLSAPKPTQADSQSEQQAISAAGRVEEDAARATPGDLERSADESEQRAQYLEDQARLKEEREEQQQRQAKRREQARRVSKKLRRHALAIVGSLAVVTAIAAGMLISSKRTGHTQLARSTFEDTNAALKKRFALGDAEAIVRLLSLDKPSRRLSRALVDLHTVAPQSKFEFGPPRFTNLLHSKGHCALTLVDQDFEIRFVIKQIQDQDQLQFEFDESALADLAVDIVDRLALAQLDSNVGALSSQLHDLFRESKSIQQANEKLKELLARTDSQEDSPGASPLSYLAYQGQHNRLELAPFRPVLGRQELESQVTLLSLDGRHILQGSLKLLLGYDCPAGDSTCMLKTVAVSPPEEPLDHRKWCIEATMARLSDAFANADLHLLEQLSTSADIEPMRKTLHWAKECKAADLLFDAVDFDSSTVRATVHYEPGMLSGSDKKYKTTPLEFNFDPQDEWGVRSDLTIAWPEAPKALRRQQSGETLLQDIKNAWRQRDAEKYIALFQGTTRTRQMAADMFGRIERDKVTIEITAREDQESDIVLYVDMKSDSPEEYPAKSHAFVLQNGSLEWNPNSADPLWVQAGQTYRDLATRLQESNWQTFDGIKNDFVNTGRNDMTFDEQGRMEQWIGAIETAREMFEPASEDYVAGLPRRVRLRSASGPPIVLRLLIMQQATPYLLYIQDREIQVSDIISRWTASDKPWETWRGIVGQPPRNQVVGLDLEKATGLARTMQCQIPTLAEWRAAAHQFAAAENMDFHGGVWEFCSDQTEDGIPLIAGGSWYDSDPDIQAAGITSSSTPAKHARFGTIGFRLCKRLEVPPEACAQNTSAVGDEKPHTP